MVAVEFWFEFASTYSYPAAMRVERVAAASGVELVWRPFLLGPLLGKQGLTDSPFNVFEQKGRYMWRDMARICEADGIDLKKPAIFPQNGLKAARVALLGMDEGWGPDFVRAVYQGNFVEGRTISDVAVIENILEALGLDAGGTFEKAMSAENKERLKTQTDTAWDKGIFGAPSFTVGDELFWGNDRMETAFDWAASH
jgi:2-hydroxychromene-2-carboxylate isomerase